jgi:hypothetical protein
LLAEVWEGGFLAFFFLCCSGFSASIKMGNHESIVAIGIS